tara:strand:+ start:24670 stop:25128 length:459 start_codon:yes stop_codon:yes gene_type:complete
MQKNPPTWHTGIKHTATLYTLSRARQGSAEPPKFLYASTTSGAVINMTRAGVGPRGEYDVLGEIMSCDGDSFEEAMTNLRQTLLVHPLFEWARVWVCNSRWAHETTHLLRRYNEDGYLSKRLQEWDPDVWERPEWAKDFKYPWTQPDPAYLL